MLDKINLENKNNIKLWENLGKTDPFWGVLTHQNKKNNKWNKNKFYETGSNNITELLEKLSDINSLSNINNVLDFGCGVGRLTKYISKNFTNVVAIDISKGMLQNAVNNNRTTRNALFIYYNSTEIPFIKDNKIDLIVSIITFQHIQPKIQVKYLHDFLRILSKNGLIYIQLVHGLQKNFKGFLFRLLGNSVLGIYHKFKYKLDYPIKIYILREKYFNQVISDNNLEIIQKTKSNNTGTAFRSYTYLLRVNK
ncbi:MAG: class I SAM-dependent methyltransferase [Flavobacteriaceae bacterium]|nr:class I SAM-dependent methyltransferase [Flavobacteriaceae bacterium]